MRGTRDTEVAVVISINDARSPASAVDQSQCLGMRSCANNLGRHKTHVEGAVSGIPSKYAQ